MSTSRQVYLENWEEQLQETIATIAEMTAVQSESPEQAELLLELRQLEEMARQVRDVPPDDREEFRSAVIAITVREHLQLSQELVSRIGELFDIYRRFRTRLVWTG